MKKKTIVPLILLAWIGVLHASQAKLSKWMDEFRGALIDGKGKNLERFFSPAMFEREMESWKYSIENGFLDFSKSELVPLSEKTVMLHIPSGSQPYSGEHEDSYFDFIYRIYEVSHDTGVFRISGRCEEAVNPDFVQIRSRIEFRVPEQDCLIESTVTVDLRSDHLIFKLAKEFEISEFVINGKKASYKRLGYMAHADGLHGERIVFVIRGKIAAPLDNNQFFSLDQNCFFLRFGGFAALPSPPPGKNGRYFFSEDTTRFEMTYIFPQGFKFLQYGDVNSDEESCGKRTITAFSEGKWLDNISFYAQRNWDITTIEAGGARLSFYFRGADRPIRESLIAEIRKLLEWCNDLFHFTPEMNFVVLDRFVENGALNDGRSIIARDARTHTDDTYIHEILHTVPQPFLQDNFLWVKEGFTNFLSFEFIGFRDGNSEFWKKQKRRFLHCFDQFTEPLSALLSTRMPTYWAAYQKGPWIYRMLAEVIGEKDFRRAMLKFGEMKGEVLVDSREYFRIFEEISGRDLKWFEEQWLDRKENPVLRIENVLEESRGGATVKIRVAQENGVFRLPLDVELAAGKNKVRKTLWIDSGEEEFSLPVEWAPDSVRFDPDCKLFAVLKTGKTSFLERDKIRLPETTLTYRFRNDSSGKEIEFRVIPQKEKISIIRKEAERESILELTSALEPLRYSVDGVPIYSVDTVEGKIIFSNAAYDIAEALYPEEFIEALFLYADWSNVSGSSLLFLRSNLKWCAAAYAESESISAQEVKVSIDAYRRTIELKIREGIPVEYTVDGNERFVLLDPVSHTPPC